MSPGVRLGGWSKGKPVPGRKRGRPRLGEEVDPNVQDMGRPRGCFTQFLVGSQTTQGLKTPWQKQSVYA